MSSTFEEDNDEEDEMYEDKELEEGEELADDRLGLAKCEEIYVAASFRMEKHPLNRVLGKKEFSAF
eukprot:3639829-Ditylum_brightwellii.AAC.1